MCRCLAEGARYAQRGTLYGKPIAELQAIQWHLTDMYMNYEASRWLVYYYAAWLRDRGERADAENAAAKFWATEAAVQCARRLIDIYGAWGNAVDHVPQRLLRDSLPLISAAGTSEIMRLVMTRTASAILSWVMVKKAEMEAAMFSFLTLILCIVLTLLYASMMGGS